jgi:hypothetical protein
MNDLTQYLFGPLDASYFCNFFLVLTIFGFVFLLGSLIMFLYGLFNDNGVVSYIKGLLIMLFYFVFYLQSRILYSMCSGTLTQ